MLTVLSQKQCRQHIICQQYHNTTGNHGLGTCPANFQCATLDVISVISGNTGNDKSKSIGLDQRKSYVKGHKTLRNRPRSKVSGERIFAAPPAKRPPQMPSTADITTSMGITISATNDLRHHHISFGVNAHDFQSVKLF